MKDSVIRNENLLKFLLWNFCQNKVGENFFNNFQSIWYVEYEYFDCWSRGRPILYAINLYSSCRNTRLHERFVFSIIDSKLLKYNIALTCDSLIASSFSLISRHFSPNTPTPHHFDGYSNVRYWETLLQQLKFCYIDERTRTTTEKRGCTTRRGWKFSWGSRVGRLLSAVAIHSSPAFRLLSHRGGIETSRRACILNTDLPKSTKMSQSRHPVIKNVLLGIPICISFAWAQEWNWSGICAGLRNFPKLLLMSQSSLKNYPKHYWKILWN